MPAGAIKFFDAQRGFGFIAPDDGGEDIFVHISAVEKSGLSGLTRDDFVEFDVERDPRTGRFIATNLDLVTAATPAQG